MTQILRQSSQAIIRVGPFKDRLDGVTMESAVILSAADQHHILRAGNSTPVNVSANIWTTALPGWYNLTLTSANTGVVGLFTVIVQDADVYLPVYRDFQVIDRDAYDQVYTTAATVPLTNVNDIASAVWDIPRVNHQTAATFGHGVNLNEFTSSGKDAVSAIITSVLSDQLIMKTDDLPSNFSLFAIDASGNVTVGANQDKTDYTLTSAAYTSAAVVALTYNWSAITVSAADRSTWNALRFLRNAWIVSGNELTVRKENDTSAAWKSTLGTIASANPVISVTPE